MKILSLLLILSTLTLTACDSEPRARQAKFYAFGTEIDISIYGVDDPTAKSTVDVLEQTFSNVNTTWHAWQPSTLTRINEAIASGNSITINKDIAQLINLASSYANQSQHLFNPAAGKLFELWGFHQDDWFISHPPPSQDEIDTWLASSPTMTDLQITNNTLSSRNKMVKLGFGGFAKGYAVDQAISALQRLGINNAIINIGGDLRAIGSHGKRPWVIGIRHPRQDGIIASIALHGDESVFTSGDYERFFIYEGKRYPHILDPRTGYPADNVMSATVLHNNASLADAAATALFVAGDNWPAIADSMGVDQVMVVKADGQIELSAKMVGRIQLINNHKPVIIRGED